jgi:biopolymer transport protein ExbB/TolQ
MILSRAILSRVLDEVYHTLAAGGMVMVPILLVGAMGFYAVFAGYARVLPAHKAVRMAGVMAAVAPLLGLLGTVTGMVHTFDVITLYGNQNPVLMAGGISEALITTQSGLIVAFPLLLFRQRLEDKYSHSTPIWSSKICSTECKTSGMTINTELYSRPTSENVFSSYAEKDYFKVGRLYGGGNG